MSSMDFSDNQDGERREKKSDFLAEDSFGSSVFSIQIMMEEIEVVVA